MKKAVNYIALLHFACIVIVWCKLVRPHWWFCDRLLIPYSPNSLVVIQSIRDKILHGVRKIEQIFLFDS